MGDSSFAGSVAPTAVFRYKQRHPLHALFEPMSIAVIGATERPGSVGRALLWNLVNHPFGGTVFPVNPKRTSVLGIKAYPALAALPVPIDLAVIATPAPAVPGLVAECVQAGVKGAIILSSGFQESGADGARMEQCILEQARRGRLRILGPNCLGIMRPITELNATFAGAMARPGTVAFISQSGALCSAVLDWSLSENVGFSTFLSIGSMVDVGWGELIEYLGSDPQTNSLLLYLETIGDARAFLSAAREVALRKPIILLKAGQTREALQAATTHTGALAVSYEVFNAACRRGGLLVVERIEDLFLMAEVLAKQPRPQGPHLSIISNAGGPAVIATDALLQAGGALANLSPSSLAGLNQILPLPWSHGNPVDILGDADPERYAKALEIVTHDPASDGLIVLLTPQAMTDPTLTAEQIKRYAGMPGKPLLACWMGGAGVESGKRILTQAGIPTFAYPDTAARIFVNMWRYAFHLRGLYETPLPSLEWDAGGPDRALATSQLATSQVEAARQAGQTLLTEAESKHLLQAYGISTIDTRIAQSCAEAVACAEAIGYPVVLKLLSETIPHKSDVGGVQLNICNAEAVRRVYQAIVSAVRERAGIEHFQGVTVEPMIARGGCELILGSQTDPQFGPVLLFGSGGRLVEIYRDYAFALPPLTTTLARRLMEQTRIFRALQGMRGQTAALEQLLVRFSYLVTEQCWIKEIDVNPLFVSTEHLLALDARMVLHEPGTSKAAIPPLAIRPYPLQYVRPWTLRDGTPVTLRPIRPEDEPLMVAFHKTLSEHSVYLRWLHMVVTGWNP